MKAPTKAELNTQIEEMRRKNLELLKENEYLKGQLKVYQEGRSQQIIPITVPGTGTAPPPIWYGPTTTDPKPEQGPIVICKSP